MKLCLIATRLMDTLQGHRFVEEVFFSEIEGWSFAVLSTWRFMWHRRFLVVVEKSGGNCEITEMRSIQRRIRNLVRKERGFAGGWRPQSWQWLIVNQNGHATIADDAAGSLREPLMVYAPDSGVLQILRSGGEDEECVRDILGRG